jgi:hypothetical protein
VLNSLVTVAAKVMDGWWEFVDPETGAGAEAVSEWFDALESQVERARAALARETSPAGEGDN